MMPGKSSKPRILFVGAFPPPERLVFGGMVSSCNVLLQSSLPTAAEFVLLDSTQISNPPPSFLVRLLLAVKRFVLFLVLFESRRPDSVLLFVSVGASIVEKGAMAWYARLRGVPAFMFPRGGAVIDGCRQSRFTASWVRLAFGGARKVLCQGPAWQRFAVKQLGKTLDDAPIIPNWTATPALLAIGKRRSMHSPLPVHLLFVGWVERKKGIFELLDACRQLRGTHSFTLEIVGEGNASAAAKAYVAEHGLEDRVRFRGWLLGKELEDVFANSDVLVLPSWAEGLPNAMIEAMAAKLAVVVSAVGNVPDVVTDGREALLVPPQDVPALTEALDRVIGDAGLRSRMGDAAFSLASSHWGVEQAVRRIASAMGIARK